MDTGYSTFNSTVHKTNRVLRDIEEAYGWRKELREQSYSALRAVLHELRARLTVQEAADFAAQLPILVRGVFYEGWDPSRVPVKMHKERFSGTDPAGPELRASRRRRRTMRQGRSQRPRALRDGRRAGGHQGGHAQGHRRARPMTAPADRDR
jgi:hypothetical protein